MRDTDTVRPPRGESAIDPTDPSLEEITESVVRCGASTGYRIDRDEAGRLQITAIDDTPVDPPLLFVFSDVELRDYYASCAAPSSISRDTPWETWLMLMSTHLDEAVWKATTVDMRCVLVIDEYGFGIRSR